jgi:hypothetical protein
VRGPSYSDLSNELDLSYLSASDLRNLKIARYIISKSVKIDRILYNFISEISFSDSSGITIFTSEDVTPVYLLDYNSLAYTMRNTVPVREIDINNNEFRNVLDEKLLCLSSFLKQVIVYKSRFSFAYVDLRYKDIVVVKNNQFSTTD